MNRTRTLLAAGGISIALVATSVGFAYANGAFGNPAVDRVGSFQAIEAQLTPPTSTSPHSSSTTGHSSTSATGSTSTTSELSVVPSTHPSSHPSEIVTTSVPGNESNQGTSVAPTSEPLEPTTATVGRTTRSTTAPHASTTSRPARDDDINDPPEDPNRDD